MVVIQKLSPALFKNSLVVIVFVKLYILPEFLDNDYLSMQRLLKNKNNNSMRNHTSDATISNKN